MLVSQVLNGAGSKGVKTSKNYLNDLHIKPCQSCGVADPKHCLFDDDMEVIYDALESCDVVVLGSPVYFDTVSAQVKLVIDHCNCLTPYVKQADGTFDFVRRMKKPKKGVFVAVGGTEQEFDTILNTVKGFFNWANIQLAETILYQHDDNERGGVRKDKKRMAKAFEVGAKIVPQKV